MASSQRKYKVKDVEMLITASTIIECAIKNKTFLQPKRSKWEDPFFVELKSRIDAAIKTFLGLDSAKELRQCTQVLKAIQKQAISLLAELKVQISEDFRKDKGRRDEILHQLGFSSFLKISRNNDQEGLIQILYQFKANLTEYILDEIVSEGTDIATLDAIIGLADALKNTNVHQESLKGQRKTVTATMSMELNEIYHEVISIGLIAAKLYKDNADMKQRFSFNKVSKALNATSKSASKSADEAAHKAA